MEVAVTETSETNNVESSLPEIEPKEEAEEVGVSEVVNSESEVTLSENAVSSDKELSWEKIAAEIAADVEENELKESEPQEHQESASKEDAVAEDTTVTTADETVINTVTEEKIVTESDTSEVILDSTEPEHVEQVEEVREHVEQVEAVKEHVEQIEEVKEHVEQVGEVREPLPVEATDLLTEAAPDSLTETIPENAEPIAEEISIEEVDEVAESIETIPVDEVIEIQELDQETAPEVTQALEEEKRKDEASIEITELKADEEPPVAVDAIEYTVIESEEVETNEIIEEHLAQTAQAAESVSETVVIINPDESQAEITIQQIEDNEERSDDSQSYAEEIYLVTKESEAVDDPVEPEVKPIKPKKQRGRKPISDIPLHVLGRDISKPTEGVSNGGRTMPKPRLGVKVPYRNLTSQIVSKQEIEKEIMERFKIKQEQNAANSGDILFARKLTQRLAKKLIPAEKEREKQKENEEAGSSVQNEKSASEIKNNSDLIAILEGDGDDFAVTKQKEELKEVAKKTEREIALEQLKELPGKNKIFKSRGERENTPQKEEKANVATVQKINFERKNQMEIEPRLRTGVVVKTYTRKRKSTEMEQILPSKKTVVTATTIKTEDGSPGSVYITKSSRVIKRKVIWDPDEIPAKSPMRSPKSDQIIKTSPVKTVEKKEPKESSEKKLPKEPIEKKEEKKIVSPVKKIISKTPPLKRFKRLTEVDKLLMDEGAVNMLYDVKTNEEATPDKLKKKTNKSVISLDKAHKELMSKTSVIKNDLQQNTNKDVQKSLRKKEIVSPPSKKEAKKEITPSAVTRKKSKDSARSSVHSPPSSPPYNAAEASRIIRRHSSSSFSSNDEEDEENGEEKVSKKRASISESPKKKAKKAENKPPKEAAKNNNNTVAEAKANHVDKTVSQYKSFKTTKKNKLVAIKLQSVEGKCYLNEEVLTELTSCLKEFGKDDDCHVVSITSDSNESFCEGLDYRLLTADDDDVRMEQATELASSVKEFLRCLLNFPKVLVAGIQGDCVGLGVTMLPLFDMVIASDTSSFSAPYSRLGCVPEAGFLLTVPHLSSNGLASELLYTSQVIKADDAFRKGLVTRLCWPEKYQQELKSLLSQVANQPRQSMEATKQQLRQNVLESTESALSSVSKVLVEYWTSPECQKNFSK